MRYILGSLCVLFAAVALAAASQGLKWNAVATYSDGTPLANGEKAVYLVYSQDTGTQVYSTTDISAAASKLPADGCYYLKAALYATATNSVVPGSESIPTSAACLKPVPPPPPPQKRLSTPTGFGAQ
jgi:hypothetical protein